MTFEEWWARQIANFDPEEIGLMQLARITWNAAEEVEREACAKVCEVMVNNGHTGGWSMATAIRARSNQKVSE